MQITKEISNYELASKLEDLVESDMIVEFGSFEGDNGQVFSCKIKSWEKWSKKMTEHAKGYGSSVLIAFSKAYERLNRL